MANTTNSNELNSFSTLLQEVQQFLQDVESVVSDVVPEELTAFLQSLLNNDTALKLLFNSIALKKQKNR